MVLELAAVISGVNTAASAIKKCAEVGQDLSTVGNMIQKLGESEVKIAKLQNSGKLNQADAIQATLAKKQIQDHMQQIKDLFIVSGNGHLWVEMMQDLATARKAEQAKAAAELQRKKKLKKDVIEIAAVTLFTLLCIPFVLFTMLTFLR
jgi:hypothetical protein